MPNNNPFAVAQSGAHDPLEQLIRKYVDDFISSNRAAQTLANGLRVVGVGLRPVVDHLTFCARDAEERAREWLSHGYEYDEKLGVMSSENWRAKVYRKNGYPAVFIAQAQDGQRGRESLITEWVNEFGDRVLYHVAVLVDDIEQAVFYLEKQGVAFSGDIAGERNTDLRQIFSAPEMKNGRAFSVLSLTERHRGYTGFLPAQSYGLMESAPTPPSV